MLEHCISLPIEVDVTRCERCYANAENMCKVGWQKRKLHFVEGLAN